MGQGIYIPHCPIHPVRGWIQPGFRVGGFGAAGGGGGGGGTLVTPVYHHWNGESSGAHPSHVSLVQPAGDATWMNVHGASTSPWLDSIEGNTTISTVDIAFVDLGGTFGAGDPGIRLQLTAKPTAGSNAFVECHLTPLPDIWGDDYLFYRVEDNDSKISYARKIGGVLDYNSSIANTTTTGNTARHYRFEALVAGAIVMSCYEFNGTLKFTKTVGTYPGTAGVFPAGLQYFGVRGVNGGQIYVYQIWAGTTEDAWPTLPMSPMTNL